MLLCSSTCILLYMHCAFNPFLCSCYDNKECLYFFSASFNLEDLFPLGELMYVCKYELHKMAHARHNATLHCWSKFSVPKFSVVIFSVAKFSEEISQISVVISVDIAKISVGKHYFGGMILN